MRFEPNRKNRRRTDIISITERKFALILDKRLLTKKELERVCFTSERTKKDIEIIMTEDFNIPKYEILLALSQYFKTPFVSFDRAKKIPEKVFATIKPNFMRNNSWVPVEETNNRITVAIDNPFDFQKTDEIRSIYQGREIRFAVALKKDIDDYITLFTDANISEVKENRTGKIEHNEENFVVRVINDIISDAYEKGASDIHIEPYPGAEDMEVRIRTDGICRFYKKIDSKYRNAIISRIKIMAGLDIAEHRKAQDGKIKFKKFGDKNIELRAAAIPTQGGIEDVVLRILPSGLPMALEDMAFSEKNYQGFIEAIRKPYGIILVCGPTGSGKTTTLHSALRLVNKTDKKIWTAEDPVEITQKGLRQVQVNPKIGFTFASAMRAFLRADPDIIMVGEMRDKETAKIGVEASLTGHLILSTLHTNSAAESIARLLDMGIESFNFADAILAVLAQRLVLTLCDNCREKFHPSEKVYRELVREFGEEEFAASLNIPYTKDFFLYKPAGCPACNNTGYKGRMAIHELLIGTENMKKAIQEKAGTKQIATQSKKEGMITLKQDGIKKVFKGYCDILQVRKVCI